MVSPAQKKKRRRSRWSTGSYSKKKSSCSPHTSRDDAHSDVEEEDGDNEEEVEKGGGAECDEQTGGEEDQMMVDVESGPAPAQEGSFGPTAKEQECQEEREEGSQAAEDKLILCETGTPESDDQTQNEIEKVEKAVTDQPEQSEEIKVLTKAGNENSETISVNTKEDSHTETEGDTQGQSNTEESSEATSQKLVAETETEKCKTVIQADRNNKVVTIDEAEQNSPAEAMEVEATDTTTTDTSAAVRGEDTGTGLILPLSYT